MPKYRYGVYDPEYHNQVGYLSVENELLDLIIKQLIGMCLLSAPADAYRLQLGKTYTTGQKELIIVRSDHWGECEPTVELILKPIATGTIRTELYLND